MQKTPSLKDFRRIVVKVGSSLLVDSAAGRLNSDWLTSLAADIASLHKEKRDLLVVSSGAIALGRAVPKLPMGALKVGGARRACHYRRPGAGHAGRYGRAPPLSQRARDHRQAAGVARRAGD